MVLLPKGLGEYPGIDLAEVLCKVVTVILNSRLTTSIEFHDVLHGFRVGSATGATSLKVKLLQKLLAIMEEVLYTIFMHLHK